MLCFHYKSCFSQWCCLVSAVPIWQTKRTFSVFVSDNPIQIQAKVMVPKQNHLKGLLNRQLDLPTSEFSIYRASEDL